MSRAEVIDEQAAPVIRAGIDGWHRPRAQRYRRGSDSAEGYYRDSFDLVALRDRLLDPLGSGGDGRYVTAIRDWRRDSTINQAQRTAPEGAVLLFDGVFLLRPELVEGWEVTIYVAADPDAALDRAVRRDERAMGGAEAARARYATRYLAGQQLYHDEVSPQEHADIVVENTDFDRPRLLRVKPSGGL